MDMSRKKLFNGLIAATAMTGVYAHMSAMKGGEALRTSVFSL